MAGNILELLKKDAEDSLLYSTSLANFEIKQDDDEAGYFSGYAARYSNVDLGGDRILKGAFDASVKRRGTKIKLLYQHRPSEPIGVLTSVKSDLRGLKVEGQLLLSLQQARDAYELMKIGALDSMSIGYTAAEKDVTYQDNIRILKRVDVREVSIVTFPMNQSATISNVKSELSEEDLVNYFEENGILNGQDAITAAKAAVKSLSRSAGGDSEAEWEELQDLSKTFKIGGVK